MRSCSISRMRRKLDPLIWIYAIAMGSFSAITAILPLFLADQFGVGEHQVWIFFTYIGVISVITRAGFLGRAVDRFGEARLSRIGLALLATGLAAYPFVHNYVLLAISSPSCRSEQRSLFSCVTSLLSRVFRVVRRGL